MTKNSITSSKKNSKAKSVVSKPTMQGKRLLDHSVNIPQQLSSKCLLSKLTVPSNSES